MHTPSNKITAITRPTCKLVREKLNYELEALGEVLGLKITAGNASYSDSSVTFKVECILEGVDKDEENFKRDAILFDLSDEDYNREFTHGAQRWILKGLKPRSPKFPIIAEKFGQPGAKYKLPERAVASLRSA